MTIVSSVLYGICLIFVMRYNLHMFQLNGYKNGEHFAWLGKNFMKQGALLLVLAAFVLNFLNYKIPVLVINIVVVLICLKYYLFLRKTNSKKKLVYTARMKRLIFTDVLLLLIALLIAFLAGGFPDSFVFVVMGAVLLQPVLVIFVNLMNSPVEKGIQRYYIRDAKKMLRENRDLTVIGVTGSYGKTSVKFYLEALLKEKFNVLVTPESYNTPMGIVKTVRSSLKSTHQIFICEMGARRVGEIRELCDIVHPRHGIITAVGPQHLETFQSEENILKTKFELADALPEGGKLFLNGDNEKIAGKSKEYDNVFLYTTGDTGEYRADEVQLSGLGTRFRVTAPDGEQCEFQTRLLGAHNVINLVGAISVAHQLGIPLKELRVPIRRIQAVPHRMQLLERGKVTVIDDAFNSNPVGSGMAVETLKMFEGMRILITPGMVELGKREEELNYLFGAHAASCCDYIFLVGRKRTEPIRKGILSEHFNPDRCIVCDSLQEAMSGATALATEEHKYILLENDLPDNY